MALTIPTLESGLYLTDYQKVIAYTLRKMFRTPKDAVPFLDQSIVSIPWIAAKHRNSVDNLTNALQNEIQSAFNRIFSDGTSIQVNVGYTTNTDDASIYDVTIAILYTPPNGEISSTGIVVGLKDGRFIIPEDNIEFLTTPKILTDI